MLEEIYENELYNRINPERELNSHLGEILVGLNALRMRILKAKLWFERQGPNYAYRKQQLEELDNKFEDIREELVSKFIEPPGFVHHPNPETRKDLV